MSRRPVPNVLHALTSRYWAILPETLETMYEIASRENPAPEAVAAKLGRPLDNTRAVTVRDGVATIPAAGPMFRYANFFTEVSGAVSYDTLATDIQAALDDPDVHTLLLEINSPGGDADGVASLAEIIYQARDQKRIVALASDYACSAAYWLASAAHEVVATPAGILGSIGVRATYWDTSERDARDGYREITILSSQSPNKAPDPATTDGQAQIRATLSALAQVFIDTMARNRGVSVEHVLQRFGQGDVLVGQAAVDAGLADRISTYETLHAELSAARGSVPPGAQTPPLTGRRTAEEKRMASRTKPGTAASAAPGTPEAAAFAADDSVRVTVARESPVLAEGDEGTVIEVRDGPHYAVRVGGDAGDYLWLSEDELEPAASGEGSGDAAPANARARAGMTVATLEGRYPQLVAQLRTEGATAERERLAAIDAIATPGHANLVAKAKADPSATAATLALQILAADKEARAGRLSARAEDEAKLDAPSPLASDATETQGPQAEASRILSIHKQVNTPRRTA